MRFLALCSSNVILAVFDDWYLLKVWVPDDSYLDKIPLYCVTLYCVEGR